VSGFLARRPRLRQPVNSFLDALVGSPLAKGRQLGRVDEGRDSLGAVGLGGKGLKG
jgi:hypothetical protein